MRRSGRTCLLGMCLSFQIVGAGVALIACGGNVAAPTTDAGEDGMGAGGDGGTKEDSGADANGGACSSSSDAAEPKVLAQVDLDGGVPLNELPFAESLALCSYLDRCSPMAAYELNECITALSQSDSWTYIECAPKNPDFGVYTCVSLDTISARWSTLLAGADAGLVQYDPYAEAACLQALQAHPCHGGNLWRNVPSCTDAGALQSCATSADCAGDRSPPAGPYCVGGYCYSTPCGDFSGCPPFVDDSQPCDSDPPRLGSSTGPGHHPCAPGLTCRDAPGDGGLGTCATPEEVGGPCSEHAAISGCALGLICQCGACRIPPSEGPCALNTCEVGVSYCDTASNTCVPVRQMGGECTGGRQHVLPTSSATPLRTRASLGCCEPPNWVGRSGVGKPQRDREHSRECIARKLRPARAR